MPSHLHLRILNISSVVDIIDMLRFLDQAEEQASGLIEKHDSLPIPIAVPEQQDHAKEEDGKINLMDSHLDDILQKAKAIREKAPTTTTTSRESSRESTKRKSTPMAEGKKVNRKGITAKSSILRESSKHQNKETSLKSRHETEMPLPPPPVAAATVTASTTVRPTLSAERHMSEWESHCSTAPPVYEAVDTLLAMRLPHPLEAVLPSKAMFLQQTQLLSQLQARPSFPPSALLSVFIRHFEHMLPGEVLHPDPEMGGRYLRRARLKFEKTWKMKLNRLEAAGTMHTLSEGEVLEICALWWNVHRCIMAYEGAVEVAVEMVDTNPFLSGGAAAPKDQEEGEGEGRSCYNIHYG